MPLSVNEIVSYVYNSSRFFILHIFLLNNTYFADLLSKAVETELSGHL